MLAGEFLSRHYLEKEDIFCDQIVGLEYETWRILNDVVEEINHFHLRDGSLVIAAKAAYQAKANPV